jgi:hypothetical protein
VSALDNEPADNDRYDLLIGRENRLRREYDRAFDVLMARLRWINEATDSRERKRQPHKLTLEGYDTDVAPTLVPTVEHLQGALRAWLEVRDELVALGPPE